MPPPRVVVIGGAGFVGRSVCLQFSRSGYDVVSVGRQARSSRPGVRTAAWDVLTKRPAAPTVLTTEAPAVVVNAAGAVWAGDPDQMEALNATLVLRLLEAIEQLPVRPRFIQLGSVHEYGPQPANTWLTETTPAAPSTPYGRTKLRGTEAVLAAHADGRVDGVVLRVTNVIGPGAPEVSLPGRVATQLAEAAARGEPAVLRLSPLRAHRDFVDALDVGTAAVRAATAPAVVGQLVNVGRGTSTPVRTVVDQLVRVSGVATTIVEAGEQEASRSRQLDWQAVDVALARGLLGWRPVRPLHQSLGDLWRSVQAQ